MNVTPLDPVLQRWALVHFAIAVVAALFLAKSLPPILGVHPAWKPMKFGVSIGVFLLTMAYLLPRLAVTPETRSILAWTLALTMLVEIIPIAGQPFRGATSHFNVQGALDRLGWNAMMLAIVVATLTMLVVAVLATIRPLGDGLGGSMSSLSTCAWRVALWCFPWVALSGFAMGGRLRHSVGGEDGGPGLPLVNWSVQHGDLRVSHFFMLHALQVLPVAAVVIERSPLAASSQWVVFSIVLFLQFVVGIGTLIQAFAGRPFW